MTKYIQLFAKTAQYIKKQIYIDLSSQSLFTCSPSYLTKYK